jgi:hypothetical protein
MDLLEKVAILIVIVVAISLAAFWVTKVQPGSSAAPTKGQVEQFVTNYLLQASPGAEVNVINATPSNLSKGSWDVFVGVVYNSTTPCPTVVEQDYNYPAINLAPRYDNNITAGCIIYSGANTSIMGISLPAIAQVKAYIGSKAAREYVNAFGYGNTNAQTQFIKSFSYSKAPEPYNGGVSDVWQVNYTANNANYSYYTILNESGGVLFGYTSNG